jgi:hypothetical protein
VQRDGQRFDQGAGGVVDLGRQAKDRLVEDRAGNEDALRECTRRSVADVVLVASLAELQPAGLAALARAAGDERPHGDSISDRDPVNAGRSDDPATELVTQDVARLDREPFAEAV